jgi:hypothetical protein
MENQPNLLGNPRKKVINNFPRNPRRGKTQKETDGVADYLVDKFQSPDFRPLFLKVAWRIATPVIHQYAELAFAKGKNPRAYFISLIKRDKNYYEKNELHSN